MKLQAYNSVLYTLVTATVFLIVMMIWVLRWLHTLFIIGGLVPNLEFSRENVKNICKNKYNFKSV